MTTEKICDVFTTLLLPVVSLVKQESAGGKLAFCQVLTFLFKREHFQAEKCRTKKMGNVLKGICATIVAMLRIYSKVVLVQSFKSSLIVVAT